MSAWRQRGKSVRAEPDKAVYLLVEALKSFEGESRRVSAFISRVRILKSYPQEVLKKSIVNKTCF